ncbi:beta-ketoacyl synthase N-terminal-like domain-containing protein [Neolewinella lacunae]|uniref:Beta-ketoacyl synthase n=1 Tax=Neolewinella lacunae TaxID=1517758 RepID=A0A923TF55_9BACT|nr:beta-ketoacyl synthase N-terminal-like domain-containing protein [Neolewinella lacunae]MBC6996642.1 beta-ketoacyl synthase [Neolewinella lacunae]MDN3634793.1 beta-ketoacyl synthase N-terminal-like domain-containing protein [Neolewinella lacunae]
MSAAAVITGHAALSCLGDSSAAIWTALRQGKIGLQAEETAEGIHCPVGRVSETGQGGEPEFTELLRRTLENPPPNWRWSDPQTTWILGSAKGNVAALQKGRGDYPLSASAQTVANTLGLVQPPICISTACTSGLAGIIHAERLLRSGKYRRVAVSGCDLASDFVLSGFNRIQAVSTTFCRPYDADRNGINLASAAATVYLEWRTPQAGEISIVGGATSNDGYHISRPSPEGTALQDCIRRSCGDQVPDFICGHGTATVLNDNTESEAIFSSGLAAVPTFSVKGQLGHTLGACGVLETIITQQCMEENTILASVGFARPGTTAAVNISRNIELKPIRNALNIAVGFGGGNAAILLRKA